MEKIVFENKKQAKIFLKKIQEAIDNDVKEFVLDNGTLSYQVNTYGIKEAK